jgi:hypothetical protein
MQILRVTGAGMSGLRGGWLLPIIGHPEWILLTPTEVENDPEIVQMILL